MTDTVIRSRFLDNLEAWQKAIYLFSRYRYAQMMDGTSELITLLLLPVSMQNATYFFTGSEAEWLQTLSRRLPPSGHRDPLFDGVSRLFPSARDEGAQMPQIWVLTVPS